MGFTWNPLHRCTQGASYRHTSGMGMGYVTLNQIFAWLLNMLNDIQNIQKISL